MAVYEVSGRIMVAGVARAAGQQRFAGSMRAIGLGLGRASVRQRQQVVARAVAYGIPRAAGSQHQQVVGRVVALGATHAYLPPPPDPQVYQVSGRAVVGGGTFARAVQIQASRAQARGGALARARFRFPDGYLSTLQDLLPPGRAWTRERGARLTRLLIGLQLESVRVERRAARLLEEALPGSSLELLPDWESVLGLSGEGTLETRRARATAKLVARGAANLDFFRLVASKLGFSVDIQEYRPFRVGSAVGGALTNGPWVHTWTVHVAAPGPVPGLEQAIREIAPAHTVVRFEYAEET